jgi:hypothetical protein
MTEFPNLESGLRPLRLEHDSFAVSPERGDSLQKAQGNLPIRSVRGESIFVTWNPKTFIEASAWRARVSFSTGFPNFIASLCWAPQGTADFITIEARISPS